MSNSDEARQSRKADRSVSPSKSADPNASIGVGDKPLELERDQQAHGTDRIRSILESMFQPNLFFDYIMVALDKRQPSSFKDTNGRKAVAKEQPKQGETQHLPRQPMVIPAVIPVVIPVVIPRQIKVLAKKCLAEMEKAKTLVQQSLTPSRHHKPNQSLFKRLQVTDMFNQGYVCEHDAMHPDNEEYEWIRASLIHPEYFPAEGWAITMPVTPIPMPVTPVPLTQTSTKSNTVKAPLSYAQVATKAAAIPQPSSPAPVKAQTRSSATKSAPHTVTPRTATPSSSSTAPMKPTASPKSCLQNMLHCILDRVHLNQLQKMMPKTHIGRWLSVTNHARIYNSRITCTMMDVMPGESGPGISTSFIRNPRSDLITPLGDLFEIYPAEQTSGTTQPSSNVSGSSDTRNKSLEGLGTSQLAQKYTDSNISVAQHIATLFELNARTNVVARKVDKESVTASFVEVTFRDQYIGRTDMWRLKMSLTGTALYYGKQVLTLGIRGQVKDIIINDWSQLLIPLKKEFVRFQRDVLEQKDASGTTMFSGTNSLASEGNILEAINLALNPFDKHYVDRDLMRTGLSIVVVTPGTGYFEVDKRLCRLTWQRMVDNGIGLDLVCLAKPPLYTVPLFQFASYEAVSVDLYTQAAVQLESDRFNSEPAYFGRSCGSERKPEVWDPLYSDEDSILGGRLGSFYTVPNWPKDVGISISTLESFDFAQYDAGLFVEHHDAANSAMTTPTSTQTQPQQNQHRSNFSTNSQNASLFSFTDMRSQQGLRSRLSPDPNGDFSQSGSRNINIETAHETGVGNGTDALYDSRHQPHSGSMVQRMSLTRNSRATTFGTDDAHTFFTWSIISFGVRGSGGNRESNHAIPEFTHLSIVDLQPIQIRPHNQLGHANYTGTSATGDKTMGYSTVSAGFQLVVSTVQDGPQKFPGTPAPASRVGAVNALTNAQMAGGPRSRASWSPHRSATSSYQHVYQPTFTFSTTTPYYVSLGDHVHRLFYDALGNNVEIKRYIRKIGYNTEGITYPCAIWSKHRSGYELRTASFTYPSLATYNWNYLDHLVAGYRKK
ncbi:hypothetical protein BSLG_006033 [Batrachochytrium salamandrivorans]|nr:hypothetical protein BSLG_006033 [Batrachochytrium salamandrivorans]